MCSTIMVTLGFFFSYSKITKTSRKHNIEERERKK